MRRTCALVLALLLALGVSPAAGQAGTPVFRFFAFSAEDLEVVPGANMSLHGSIHGGAAAAGGARTPASTTAAAAATHALADRDACGYGGATF